MNKFRINNTIIKYLFAIAFLLLSIGFCVLSLEVENSQKDFVIYTQMLYDEDYKKNEFYVELNHTDYWLEEDGSVYAYYYVTLINNTTVKIADWELNIPVQPDNQISDSWNADVAIVDGMLTIKSSSNNREIASGEKEVVGYVLTSAIENEINMINVKARKIYTKEDFSLYKILGVSAIAYVFLLVIYIIIQWRIELYKAKQEESEIIISQALKTFANFVDAKDHYTRGHSMRVAACSKEIARRMKLTKDVQQRIYYIALLHDVGKIAISESILNKPTRLEPHEIEEMHKHTIKGAEMLADFTALQGIAEGALYHHERYDGTGYPKGISGKHIPLYARIIGVADAYDVMSHGRCYRDALDMNTIIKELQDNSGTQFDPKIVPYMIDMIKEGFSKEY